MTALPPALPELLLAWYDAGHRDLPWRRDTQPYHVWLSEIMLQQTRVEAVRGYYARFLEELPAISDLAACNPDRLQKLWEGLGYYSRVRNLQKAARIICDQYGGQFPREHSQILALPGIGDYTAGAIASICFDAPTPAVDGNVLRVLSRLLADGRSIGSAAVRKDYAAALAQIYPAGRCGAFTQSLMELGATLCGPNAPAQCERCPLAALCEAKRTGTQQAYPVKEARKPRRTEEKTVFILTCGDALAVCRRPRQGLLAGLWELPNVPGRLASQQALQELERLGAAPRELLKMTEKTHVFTHITWQLRGFYVNCSERSGAFTWVSRAQYDQTVALPTAFRQFLEQEP